MTDAQDILRHLASSSGFSVHAIRYGSRRRPLVWVRQVAHWLLRNMTGASLPMVGIVMGNCDHTTARAACRKVELEFALGFGPRLDILLDFIEYTRARAS